MLRVLLPLLLAAPAAAQEPVGDTAFPCVRAGECLPLGTIIGRVNTQVRGRYLGSEYDRDTRTYRLKYMREDRVVVWVDVDARNGRILRRVGE